MADTELLDLVALIYDAALEPARWHAAIDAIRERLGFHNSMMSLIDLTTSRAIISVQVNIPAAYDAMAGPRHISSVVALWGGAEALARHIVEEPVILSNATDPTTWESNLYYQDFARPQGIIDVMAVALVRSPGLTGDLGFGRHQSAGRPGPAEVEKLRILAPHIRRAALVSGMLDTSASALATLEATVEATPAGVVLVDRDMRIVHTNSAASRMLADANCILRLGGRLELRHELLRGQLAGAVAAAAESTVALGRRGIGIPARRADGSPLVLHVVPLTPRQSRTHLFRGAVAAVFVADSDGATRLGDALGLLFGLTPAETRVFELVAAGLSSREIAESLGVAPSTLKTHLLRVYEKTGRHRRSELAVLAREILP